jgi:hypothetical protein
MTTSLRDFLLDAYDVPARRRDRDPAQDQPIRIDDDTTADLFRQFCQVHIQVPDPSRDEIILTLSHVPANRRLMELINERDGEFEETPCGLIATIPLNIQCITYVRRLAKSVGSLGGQRHQDPDWYWLCRRKADSLHFLADVLWEYRKKRRSTTGPQHLNQPFAISVT